MEGKLGYVRYFLNGDAICYALLDAHMCRYIDRLSDWELTICSIANKTHNPVARHFNGREKELGSCK
jgi:hypothetical protein